MRALVYSAPLELRMEDLPEPEPAADEVLVEVHAVGICGSELEGFKSRSPFRVPPLVMGHEIAGVRLDTGERVAVNPLLSCGVCDLCRRGHVNLCRERSLLGIHRPGGFAERVAVPRRALHEVPAGMSFEQASLVEPFANAFHAVRLAQERERKLERVAIVGAGMLGLATGVVARHCGADDVAICDRSPQRLETARRAGLRPLGEVLDGECDVVVDAVGSAETRRMAMAALRPGGTAVWLGLHSPDAGIDALALTRAEQCVVGTFAYVERDFRAALAFAAQLDATTWVASRPLEEGVETFLALVEAPAAATKTLLAPQAQ